MDAHLGGETVEVHDVAQAVLAFWFDELTPEQHFAVDPAIDRKIADRFGALREDIVTHDALGWRATPDLLLAAIIVLDQFSRNIFREDGRAYEADPLALSLTRYGIERGWHETLPPERAIFLLMPLMHAERADAQADSVTYFTALGVPEQIEYAEKHRDVIERFGRFPSRNAMLGRETKPEEAEFLSRQGTGW